MAITHRTLHLSERVSHDLHFYEGPQAYHLLTPGGDYLKDARGRVIAVGSWDAVTAEAIKHNADFVAAMRTHTVLHRNLTAKGTTYWVRTITIPHQTLLEWDGVTTGKAQTGRVQPSGSTRRKSQARA